MNKFNKARRNVQRERRAKRSQQRRLAHPALKISTKSSVQKPPGKKLRTLERKWRKCQKEAIASGLVTMEDIEMVTSGSGTGATNSDAKEPRGVNLKKRIKRRQMKRALKPAAAEPSNVEAMEE